MRYWFGFVFLLISACQFGPEYKRPEVDFKPEWQSKSEYINNEVLQDKWWELLDDKLLNKLIEEAALNNYDVAIAAANIEKARAVYNIAKSDFFPDLNYDLSGIKRSFSNNANNFNVGTRHEYAALLDASWELDFWGGIRKRASANKERYYADIEAKRDMLLSVAAEVADNYIRLRGFQKQLEITEENVALLEQTIKLTELQNKVGVADNFDVARAKAQKETIRATEPNIKANIYTSIYQLSFLVGKEPSYLLDLLVKKQDLPKIKAEMPVGLPSELLRRRPDVRQAEHILIAENADIGAAIADFFPSFSLTAALGHSSFKFADFFSNDSSSYNYGAAVNIPLFRGGELKANYKQAKAENNVAMLEYERTVMNALNEVEASLVRYAKETETKQRLDKVVEDNEKIVLLAKGRYSAGYTDLLEVIDAERNLILARNADLQSEVNILVNMISLYKALGGGFEG